jgi:hypothetical protein
MAKKEAPCQCKKGERVLLVECRSSKRSFVRTCTKFRFGLQYHTIIDNPLSHHKWH